MGLQSSQLGRSSNHRDGGSPPTPLPATAHPSGPSPDPAHTTRPRLLGRSAVSDPSAQSQACVSCDQSRSLHSGPHPQPPYPRASEPGPLPAPWACQSRSADAPCLLRVLTPLTPASARKARSHPVPGNRLLGILVSTPLLPSGRSHSSPGSQPAPSTMPAPISFQSCRPLLWGESRPQILVLRPQAQLWSHSTSECELMRKQIHSECD